MTILCLRCIIESKQWLVEFQITVDQSIWYAGLELSIDATNRRCPCRRHVVEYSYGFSVFALVLLGCLLVLTYLEVMVCIHEILEYNVHLKFVLHSC
jgi:hypothetical protein